MRNKRLFQAAALAVALVGALVGPTVPAQAIISGAVVAQAPPWVAYVSTTTGRFCTGTVVADRWVLTAAHCVVTQDKKGSPTTTKMQASKFRVVLGRNDLRFQVTGKKYMVDAVKVYPQWSPTKYVNDVALLHLTGTLPSAAMPLPLAPTAYSPPDGADMTGYGYGNTSETYKKKALAKGDLSNPSGDTSNVLRRTMAGSYTLSLACSDDSDWCLKHTGTSAITHGDSGGPWVSDPSNPFVVGVTSAPARWEKVSDTTVNWTLLGAAKIGTRDIHSWIVSNAQIRSTTIGNIYRDQDSGRALLVQADGFGHPVPTGGDYQCFVDQGYTPLNLPAFQLAEIPASTNPAICSPVSVILASDAPTAVALNSNSGPCPNGNQCWIDGTAVDNSDAERYVMAYEVRRPLAGGTWQFFGGFGAANALAGHGGTFGFTINPYEFFGDPEASSWTYCFVLTPRLNTPAGYGDFSTPTCLDAHFAVDGTANWERSAANGSDVDWAAIASAHPPTD